MKFDVLRRHIGDKLYEEGDQRDADERDVAHLVRNGVLRPAIGEAASLRDDGPTVADYVAAGYLAENYPPQGYASRSAPEEIAEAVAVQGADAKVRLEQEVAADGQMAEPAPKNKAAPAAPKTKAVG